MKTLNEKIVRILLNHTEVLKHNDRLIEVIPNGDIEDIASEIEKITTKHYLTNIKKQNTEPRDCAIHNTDFTGKCFICGEQVFTKGSLK